MASGAELLGDALAEVFARLPFEDRMRTSLVCKAWRTACRDPICWRNVDMMGWFQNKVDCDYLWEFDCESTMDALTRWAVDRSEGQLRELRTAHCTDATIEHIANSCPLLTVLSIPNSLMVTDASASKLAACWPKLQELDISDCYNISDQALATFGKSCPSLVWLGRNMLSKNTEVVDDGSDPGGDEEAIVVSKHMRKLKHLEMKKTGLSDLGLAHLASGCGQLETLNLACCAALSPGALENVAKQCVNLKDFTKPVTPRMYVNFPHFLLFD